MMEFFDVDEVAVSSPSVDLDNQSLLVPLEARVGQNIQLAPKQLRERQGIVARPFNPAGAAGFPYVAAVGGAAVAALLIWAFGKK